MRRALIKCKSGACVSRERGALGFKHRLRPSALSPPLLPLHSSPRLSSPSFFAHVESDEVRLRAAPITLRSRWTSAPRRTDSQSHAAGRGRVERDRERDGCLLVLERHAAASAKRDPGCIPRRAPSTDRAASAPSWWRARGGEQQQHEEEEEGLAPLSPPPPLSLSSPAALPGSRRRIPTRRTPSRKRQQDPVLLFAGRAAALTAPRSDRRAAGHRCYCFFSSLWSGRRPPSSSR